MKPKKLARSRWYGKNVFFLLLALQMAGPPMYAISDDAPIDYANFRSAEAVRAAAMRRVDQMIQASMTPVVAEPALPVDPSTSVDPQARAENLVDTPLAAAGVTASQPGSALPLPQEHKAPEILATPTGPAPLEGRALALGDASLDEVRGGFEVPGTNLKYSFGIERAVFINGELIARTVLRLQDLGTVAGRGVPMQAVAGVNDAATTVDVIQNGAGNNFTAQVGPDRVGTVIQNTLNNQKIQHVTTINASVNSLQVMRAMSVQSAVQSGIVDSLRR